VTAFCREHWQRIAGFAACHRVCVAVAPSPQSASDDFDQFDAVSCEPSASTYAAAANVPSHAQPPGINHTLFTR